MHKCISYGPDKLNLWPFWSLFDPYDLDLQPTWKNVSDGTSPFRGQQLRKIILKSMHKCTSYALDKLNIWPFWPLFDPCDLDLQPTCKNVSNGTSPPRGQEQCKIIFNSMHKCTSYAQDKLNTCIWPFWPWPSFYLIKCFKRYVSSSKATTVPNCFEIHALLYKFRRTHGCTDAWT